MWYSDSNYIFLPIIMDKVVFSYIRTHTMLILTLLLSAFLLLAVGEFILYRNVMKINEMLSEGLIQIKESRQVDPIPTPMTPLYLSPTPGKN